MLNIKKRIGSQQGQQKSKPNTKIKLQDFTQTLEMRHKIFTTKQANRRKDVLESEPAFKQGPLYPLKPNQKNDEKKPLKDSAKGSKFKIKQAFQRCMGLTNQLYSESVYEGQTNPEPPMSPQQSQRNNLSGGLLGQFLKPISKNPSDFIQISSDSSRSSKIGSANHHFQAYRQSLRPATPQKYPQHMPTLVQTSRVPFSTPHMNEGRSKSGLKYQLPNRTFNHNYTIIQGHNSTSRYDVASLNERNHTMTKPVPPFSTSNLQQNSYPKQNKTNPLQLKFADHTSSTQFRHQAHLPFPKTQFYIHIDLLTQEQIDRRVLKQHDSKKNDNRRLGKRSSRPISPSPIPSKYKISNSHHKYKQEKIDNYINNEQKKEHSFNKAVAKEEAEDEILPDLSRMAKRNWKYPKVHHPLAIQGQMPLKNIKFDEFLERRARKQGGPRDLGVLSLDEVVQQCFSKRIIPQEVYVEYVKCSTPQMPIKFAQLFLDRKTDDWDYEQLKITLFDHRRLAEVLAKTFPNDYVIYQPHALQKDVHDFLSNLYLLTASDYKAMLESIDANSGVDFWEGFNIRFEKYFDQPLLILPYQSKQGEDKPLIKWSDSNGPDSRYTPAEMKLMKNYRATREKLKEGCQKEKESAYIDCGQDLGQWSSSSSDLSQEPSETYNPSKVSSAARNNAKKSGKGRVRQNK